MHDLAKWTIICRDVLEGVLLLMGIEDTSWNSMKGFLGKRSVKEDIISYDAARISPATRAKVEKLLATKGQSFEEKVSVAAADTTSAYQEPPQISSH